MSNENKQETEIINSLAKELKEITDNPQFIKAKEYFSTVVATAKSQGKELTNEQLLQLVKKAKVENPKDLSISRVTIKTM